MKCIISSYPNPYLPLSQHVCDLQLKASPNCAFVSVTHQSCSNRLYGFHRRPRHGGMSCKASMGFPSSLLPLAVVTPKPHDTGVLLLTGSVMLTFYLVTNFVVPKIVVNSLGLEGESTENQQVESDEDEE